MYFTKPALVLSLATGFAAASPLAAERFAVRHPEPVPAFKAPETFPAQKKRSIGGVNLGGVGSAFNNINNINSINDLFDNNNNNNNNNDNFNFQNEAIQINEVNITEVSDGVNTAIVQQVQQVLVVDQRNNQRNNQFRRNFYRNNFNDVSTVMLVVQEIQIQVADNVGNQFQQQIFAESAVVANAGRFQSQTIQITDVRQLIATQILGGVGNQGIGAGIGGNNGIGQEGASNTVASVAAQATGDLNNNAANSTASVTLLDKAPTWTSIANDPAASAQATEQAQAQQGNADVASGGKAKRFSA